MRREEAMRAIAAAPQTYPLPEHEHEHEHEHDNASRSEPLHGQAVTRSIGPATLAIAEAWAQKDGRIKAFRAGRANRARDAIDGTFPSYVTHARDVERRLRALGYELRPVQGDPVPN